MLQQLVEMAKITWQVWPYQKKQASLPSALALNKEISTLLKMLLQHHT
jgi:hypothetical protein